MTRTEGWTYVGLPVAGLGFVSQPCARAGERLDLLAELVSGVAAEPHDLPVQRRLAGLESLGNSCGASA